MASCGYRTLQLPPQQQSGQNLPANLGHLSVVDVPDSYAYEDAAQGERLLKRQIEALDAQRHQGHATGTVSTAARDQLVILRAQHSARNNLRADHKAQVRSILGQLQLDKLGVKNAPTPQDSDNAPLYQCELDTQSLAQPVRMVNL